MMQPSSATCPLAQLYGIETMVSEVNSGVAVTFVAPENERERLREIVRDMATPAPGASGDMFAGCSCRAALSAAGPMSPSAMSPSTPRAASSGPSELARERAPRSAPLVFSASAREDDTATGAILVLKAPTSAEATALDTAVREKLTAMQDGCP
jgi:hypothetical protein